MSGFHKTFIILVTLTVLLAIWGCVPKDEIQVSKDTVTLIAGQSETIQVTAVTREGKSVPFDFKTEGSCISAFAATGSIRVTAGPALCEQTITVKAGSAEDKTIKVTVDETVELQVDKEVLSLYAGQSETINVRAVTSKGKSIPFELETEGSCIVASSEEDSIRVTAGPELCEQTITVKSSLAGEKTIKVMVDETVEIQLEKNITSLTAGKNEKIQVQAVTTKGKSVPFDFETKGSCIATSAEGEAISITAGSELCEQTITVKSGLAEEKTIKVIVYDPMVMDIGEGLLIRYVNSYKAQWNDLGSGGKYDVAFWHPLANGKDANGNDWKDWYPLGSLIVNHYDNVNQSGTYPMIVVKDTSKDQKLLAPPTDYELIYNDKRSGAYLYGSVWKAVCPDNYVSFGVVTNGAKNDAGWLKPSLDAIRCVREDFALQAAIGNRMYIDKGTGAKMYLGVWSVIYPTDVVSPDGRAALLTGVTLGCPGWEPDKCDPRLVNLLLVPLPVYTSSENMMQPRLTGYEPLNASPRFFSSIRVPFTLIPSEFQNATPARIKTNIEKSPFYYVQREETYMPVNIVNNTQNPNPAEYKYVISTGFEESESKKFSMEVGMEVTANGECSFFGVGGGWEVKLSTKFGWERSVARTYSEVTTRDFTFTVSANTYAEIVQVTSQFRAIPMTDSVMPQSRPFDMNSNMIMYLQYPPPSLDD